MTIRGKRSAFCRLWQDTRFGSHFPVLWPPHSLKSLRRRSEIGGQYGVFQSPGIGVLGIVEDLARFSLFDDHAFAHDDDPVGASKANKFVNIINLSVYLGRNCAEY